MTTVENTLEVSLSVSKLLKRPLTDNENLKIAMRVRNDVNTNINVLTNQLANILSKSEDRQDMRNWQKNEMLSDYNATDELSDISYANRQLVNDEYESKHFDRETRFDASDDEYVRRARFDSSKPDREFTTLVGKEINLNTLFNIDDLYKLQQVLAPKAQYRHVHVLLDTDNAAPELSSGTKYGWNFSDNALLQGGTVNTTGSAQNLVGMRIHPMKTDLTSNPSHHEAASFGPSINLVPSGGIQPIYRNDFVNLNQNFTILIEEFSAQAFVGREGRKFHFVLFPFLMNPDTRTDAYYGSWTPLAPYYEFVTSGKGDGWFWFREPITEFSTLTVSMANPFEEFTLSEQTRTLIPLELIYLVDENGE